MASFQKNVVKGLVALMVIGFGSTSSATQFVRTDLSINFRGTMQGTSYNAIGSQGIYFTTGPGGPFTIDRIDTIFGLDPGTTIGSCSFQIDVRNVTSGVAGSTLYASDTVTFQVPSSIPALTFQNMTFGATDLINISGFAFQSSTAYSVVFYKMSSPLISLAGSSTSPASQTVTYSSGFSNAGFFGNNFSTSGSKQISLGQPDPVVTTVPEPSTAALAGAGSLALAAFGLRSRRTAA